MDYFENLPKITYTEGNVSNVIRNLFFKIQVTSDINNEYLINYEIQDGQTLEDISFDVYGDPKFWWIIALVNDIQDVIYDLPLDDSTVTKIATAKAKTVKGKITTAGTFSIVDSSLAGSYNDDYFNGNTFQHLTGTNATQTLTISDYTGATGEFKIRQKLILDDASAFTVGGDITGDGVSGNDGVGVVYSITDNDVYVTVTSGTFVETNDVDNANPYSASEATISSYTPSLLISKGDTWIIEDATLDTALFSSYYDLLETYNSNRRTIKVLRQDYLKKFMADVTKEVSDNT
jgi:hypothetical protein